MATPEWEYSLSVEENNASSISKLIYYCHDLATKHKRSRRRERKREVGGEDEGKRKREGAGGEAGERGREEGNQGVSQTPTGTLFCGQVAFPSHLIIPPSLLAG